MAKILVIHGPNLNLLGEREPHFYGKMTLKKLNQALIRHASHHEVECFQSNAEHDLIDKIQSSRKAGTQCIIINPAAFTHTSIAIRDALLAVNLPFFEVHLSNIYARETFRHYSYLSDIAVGVISGLGVYGYYAALDAALARLSQH